MFVHTRSSAPKIFAKFEMENSNVLSQKMERATAKLQSDKLYSIHVGLAWQSFLRFRGNISVQALVREYMDMSISSTIKLFIKKGNREKVEIDEIKYDVYYYVKR